MQSASLTRLLPITALAVGGLVVELSVWGGKTGLRWGGSIPLGLLVLACVVGLGGPVLTRVKPVPGFVLTAATSVALNLAVPGWEAFTGLFISLFLLARMESARRATTGLALTMLPLSVIIWNSAGWDGPVTVPSLLPVLVLWVLLALAIWGAGRAVNRSRDRIRNLERRLLEAENVARVAERRAIARDLHDIVAHSVVAIQLQAGGARALMSRSLRAPESTGERLSNSLSNIEDLAHQAMRELHRLLVTLRTEDAVGTSPGSEPLGGLADLESLLTSTRDSGVDVEVRQSGQQIQLDPSIELAAYRMLQECLTNGMRHAGAGSRMLVDIVWGTDLVIETLSTKDSGPTVRARGSKESVGLGLVGLSERLASVGGSLTTEASQDGFRVTARIPLDT